MHHSRRRLLAYAAIPACRGSRFPGAIRDERIAALPARLPRGCSGDSRPGGARRRGDHVQDSDYPFVGPADYTYALLSKPSVMVRNAAAVKALAAAIEKDIRSDLERYDIQDVTAVRRMHGTLLTMFMLKGDYAEARNKGLMVRGMQEKPAGSRPAAVWPRPSSRRQGSPRRSTPRCARGLEAALVALPGTWCRTTSRVPRAISNSSPRGWSSAISRLARSACGEGGKLSQQLASNFLDAAYTLSFILPAKDTLHAAYASVVDAHKEA